jgi:hypothetical protein
MLDYASAPPRSYGKRLELAEGTSLRGYLATVQMKLVIFTQFRFTFAEVFFFCTTIKYVRRAASGAAVGNGLGTTIKYLRRTRNGAAGNGLGTTIKYL